MNGEAALFDEALRLCRFGGSAGCVALLERLRREATRILFQDSGRTDRGRSIWRVGSPGSPALFVAKSDTIRLLHILVQRGALSIDLVNPEREPSDAPEREPKRKCEAARGKIYRALAEIREYSPALADELGHFETKDGHVRYARGAGRPLIDVGNALETATATGKPRIIRHFIGGK